MAFSREDFERLKIVASQHKPDDPISLYYEWETIQGLIAFVEAAEGGRK